MATETSIPCSFEARDLLREQKSKSQSWDEFLKERVANADGERTEGY